MKKTRSRWIQGAAIGVVCAATVSHCFHHGWLEILEFKALDHRFRSMPQWSAPSSPADISIIVIDQTSLELVHRKLDHRWQWPREFYAKMLGFLKAAGARAVVFDMYFSEPDRDHVDILGADSDAALVAATRYTTNVFHSYVLQRDGLLPEPEKYEAIASASAFPGDIDTGVRERLLYFKTGAIPSAELATASTGIGFATVTKEKDNICRRIQMAAAFSNATVMCQSLAVGHQLLGRPPLSLSDRQLSIGTQGIQTDSSSSAFLWWYRPEEDSVAPFPLHSAYNVLRAGVLIENEQPPGIDPTDFKDRIVYIGSTAPGLFDNWATPLAGGVPGVMIQATALANLLRDDFVSRLPARYIHMIILLLCLVVASTTCVGRRHIISMLIPLLLLAGVVAAGYGLLAQRHLFVDIVPPALAIGLTFGITTITNYLTERRHSRMVRGIFEHYLDRSVVNNLIANPDQVRLGGEKRECTVLFTDVANFTNTSEQLGPEQVVHFMNVYLNAMTDIIIEEGGFVDKFIGDEIIAIFGAPNALPDHAERACQTVLRMRDKVRELQPEFEEAGCKSEIFARTGLCTGDVVIGNMGSDTRMNYTAMGNTMNLGSRIQGICKAYGSRALVSESTAAAAGDAHAFREIDIVQVKGKEHGEKIFELLGTPDTRDLPDDHCHRFQNALALFRKQEWEKARSAFNALAEAGDSAASVFAGRCEEYAANPPPADWDGIYVMATK